MASEHDFFSCVCVSASIFYLHIRYDRHLVCMKFAISVRVQIKTTCTHTYSERMTAFQTKCQNKVNKLSYGNMSLPNFKTNTKCKITIIIIIIALARSELVIAFFCDYHFCDVCQNNWICPFH